MKKLTSTLLVLALLAQTTAWANEEAVIDTAAPTPAATATTSAPIAEVSSEEAASAANRKALQENSQKIQEQIQEINELQKQLDSARRGRNTAIVIAGTVATISVITVAARTIGAWAEFGGSLIEGLATGTMKMRTSKVLISNKALLITAGGSAAVGIAVVTFKAFEITKINKTLVQANQTLQLQLEQNRILLQQN